METETHKGKKGFWLGAKFCSYDRRMIPTAKKLYEANVLTKKDMQEFGFLRKKKKDTDAYGRSKKELPFSR